MNNGRKEETMLCFNCRVDIIFMEGISTPINWEVFDRYLYALSHDEEVKTGKEYAEELGVTEETICRWRKKIDFTEVLAIRRKSYASKMADVDKALFYAATKKHSVEAAKLLYERFDGWTPTTKTLNDNESNDELKQRILKLREEFGVGQSLGEVSSAPAQ